VEQPFPPSVISEAMHWGLFFSEEWRQDFPDQIHQHRLSGDGTREWAATFSAWLSNSPGATDQERGRTTRVMRKLRRIAPRAYEVLYRTMVEREPLEETTRWLNERAARNAIPLPDGRDVHYRLKDTVALFISGVDYARTYW
jgi:hypothetical protein